MEINNRVGFNVLAGFLDPQDEKLRIFYALWELMPQLSSLAQRAARMQAAITELNTGDGTVASRYFSTIEEEACRVAAVFAQKKQMHQQLMTNAALDYLGLSLIDVSDEQLLMRLMGELIGAIRGRCTYDKEFAQAIKVIPNG